MPKAAILSNLKMSGTQFATLMDTEIISQAEAAQAVKYLFAFLNLSGDDLGLKFNKT